MRNEMREIGGYIELDKYSLPMLHEGAIALNSGRNCLAYLIRAKEIFRIVLPKFLCASVREVCNREQIQVRYYSVGINFLPEELELAADEWLYLVNYYGQLDERTLQEFLLKYKRVIVDNTHAYFQMPVEGVDTLYTCRKFFGVPDGAFLYTDCKLNIELERDESFYKMQYLLGRYERCASEFYGEYVESEHAFSDESIKSMAKLTDNLLHGIDYEAVKKRRTDNFTFLHNVFRNMNKLRLAVPEGAFMYPLYISGGAEIRKKLQAEKIYIPTLWPDVFECCKETELEYNMAKNILPLPIDQRYGVEDMQYMIEQIKKYM